jgi:hypothetical protein
LVLALQQIALLTVSLALAQAQEGKPVPQAPAAIIKEVKAKDIETKVVIELYHENRELVGPCFSMYITGWEPNDSVEVFAFDEKKQKVEIVGGEKRLPVSAEGKCSFSVPYDFHAFAPGRWLIVVSGKAGMHGHYVDIPKPEQKK